MTRPCLLFVSSLAVVLTPLFACCQEVEKPPAAAAPEPDAAEDPVAAMQAVFAEQGIELDRKAGTITIPVQFGEPTDPIEFLLIHPRGKAHESVLMSRVKGSVLHAAFLALGYEKGQNVRFEKVEPEPTEEEVQQGAKWFHLYPPKGRSVWLTLKWQYVDDDGEKVDVEIPIEDLILDLATGRAIEDADFVYLGGQMASLYRGDPPVYVADYEGNYVSSVYKPEPNHLVTIRHEHANDDQRWWVTERMQPRDKSATLVFHATETKLHQQRRERIEKERAARKEAGEPDQLPPEARPDAPQGRTGGRPDPDRIDPEEPEKKRAGGAEDR